MTTKTQIGSSIRIVDFTISQFKSEILKLSYKKDTHLKRWLKIWHQIKNLPDNYRKLDFIMVKSMKCLEFSFQSGHRIFNEGVCRGLGRSAMLLGIFLAEKNLKNKISDNVRYTRILENMRGIANPNGKRDLNKDDKKILLILKVQ